MNAKKSDAIRVRLLGFGMKISEPLAHRKFVSARGHAHLNAQNSGSYSFDARIQILTEIFGSYQ